MQGGYGSAGKTGDNNPCLGYSTYLSLSCQPKSWRTVLLMALSKAWYLLLPGLATAHCERNLALFFLSLDTKLFSRIVALLMPG